jgi:6,7-dimethyl-8-ribityllumazine synthase
MPAPTPIRLAIVTSRFNEEVTGGLKKGVFQILADKYITTYHEFDAPGAFEIPLIAKALAQSSKFDGVICLGCVIKGDTAHFEFISLGATLGIQQTSLETGVPIAFGILTTYTDAQAEVRSADDAHNKGREAALACIETIETLRAIKKL